MYNYSRKPVDTLLNEHVKEVSCKFGGSQKILKENGSEFENLLFLEVSTQLGIKYLFSFQYRPQANGCIQA